MLRILALPFAALVLLTAGGCQSAPSSDARSQVPADRTISADAGNGGAIEVVLNAATDDAPMSIAGPDSLPSRIQTSNGHN